MCCHCLSHHFKLQCTNWLYFLWALHVTAHHYSFTYIVSSLQNTCFQHDLVWINPVYTYKFSCAIITSMKSFWCFPYTVRMAGWHYWLDGRESEWTPGVGDGQGGQACCSSRGRKELDMTERLNWTEGWDWIWELKESVFLSTHPSVHKTNIF